ncbi:unnamed protein product [Prorocentrum cordatum]|uniref:Uncharacterized protein n=1 Tax=Prorocentrum cordatum TaxID=2364126 RepID=A0ABN9Y1A7_9DINO|nr:unnamed protein product [Polarella glacialis]
MREEEEEEEGEEGEGENFAALTSSLGPPGLRGGSAPLPEEGGPSPARSSPQLRARSIPAKDSCPEIQHFWGPRIEKITASDLWVDGVLAPFWPRPPTTLQGQLWDTAPPSSGTGGARHVCPRGGRRRPSWTGSASELKDNARKSAASMSLAGAASGLCRQPLGVKALAASALRLLVGIVEDKLGANLVAHKVHLRAYQEHDPALESTTTLTPSCVSTTSSNLLTLSV